MARAYFDRTVPFGFTREQGFFAEVVDIAGASNLLVRAENMRSFATDEKKIRDSGKDALTQAREMAEVLKNG